jgi:hypothetical protein
LKTWFRSTTLLFSSLIVCSIARAQADPTATQPLQLSAFGAATGTWTGLDSGRNIGITAGFDVSWKPFFRFYPSVEVRGTYPFVDGKIDAQENVLYGFKAERYYGRLHPYANVLLGRDKIDFQHGGFPNAAGTLLFIDTVSNVFSYGGGVDLGLTDQFALKVDAQFQDYGTPVVPSGHLWSKPISVGIVYHINFNHRIHYDHNGQVKGYKPPPEPKAAPVPPPAPDNAAPDNAAPVTAAPTNPAPNTSSPQPPVSDAAPATSPPAKPSPDTPAPSSQPQQPQ